MEKFKFHQTFSRGHFHTKLLLFFTLNMAARKRMKISLQTKYEIIKCFENKIKVKDIQEKFELKDRKNVQYVFDFVKGLGTRNLVDKIEYF